MRRVNFGVFGNLALLAETPTPQLSLQVDFDIKPRMCKRFDNQLHLQNGLSIFTHPMVEEPCGGQTQETDLVNMAYYI